jgi:hypothetical protein
VQRFQSNAEFLQGRFRNLCSTAIALGKQEHCIRKRPAGRIIGQSAIGYETGQCWPSDVKCLKQAVIRSGKCNYGTSREAVIDMDLVSLVLLAVMALIAGAMAFGLVHALRQSRRKESAGKEAAWQRELQEKQQREARNQQEKQRRQQQEQEEERQRETKKHQERQQRQQREQEWERKSARTHSPALQDEPRTSNIDSKIHLLGFDCFKF